MIFDNDRAIYLQIADYFFEQILNKELLADSRIWSVRDFAIQLEVNPNTVMRTYKYLQDMEVIYNKRGIGYFVSENAFEKVQSKRKKEFMQQELPKFFRTMDLLGISIDELAEMKKQITIQ